MGRVVAEWIEYGAGGYGSTGRRLLFSLEAGSARAKWESVQYLCYLCSFFLARCRNQRKVCLCLMSWTVAGELMSFKLSG